MPAITLTDLTFSYTSEPLLAGVSFTVANGERACLTGPNGCGKTTLLRLVTGDLVPDSGSVAVTGACPEELRRAPEVLSMAGTVEEYLARATASVRALATRFEEVTTALTSDSGSAALAREYDELLAGMDAADAWSLGTRTELVLAGLGLGGLDQGRDLATLSPGQRGRLELVATLLASPAALVLDEPTNHLDEGAVAYLADILKAWRGPVLLASHDRAFIDDVATVLLDLDTAPWQALATERGQGRLPGVARCAGRYSDYLPLKAAARASHAALHAGQQESRKRLREHRVGSQRYAGGGIRLANAQGKEKKFFADRASRTVRRRTRADDRRLEALETVEVRKPRAYRLTMGLPSVRSSSGITIAARTAAVPGRLAPITLDLSAGDHLLVTGPNGCGKSTLLTWLATGRAPTADATGSVDVGGRVAVVPQRLPRPGDPGLPKATWDAGIGALGAGVLHPALWHRCVGDLSAGNQRRVQLALAIAAAPEVLLVDEPTNYLDLDSVEALEEAFAAWDGTLVVASHDRWLVEHWDGRRLDLTSAEGTGSHR